MVLFQPGAAEVHAEVAKWFDDWEIYQWFADNLHRVREPSMRHYVRARELKPAGMDWTDVLAVEDENPCARLAAELLATAADYGSTAERVKAFVEQGEGVGRRSSTTGQAGPREPNYVENAANPLTVTGLPTPPDRTFFVLLSIEKCPVAEYTVSSGRRTMPKVACFEIPGLIVLVLVERP